MDLAARTLQCTGCGAKLQLADTQLAAECGYCRAALVDAERGAAAIDAILPLSVSAERAAREVQAFLRRQSGVAREARRQLADPRQLRTMFVPHWAATGVLRTRWKAEIGIDWTETTTRTNSRGEKESTSRSRTDWFDLQGRGVAAAERQLVSASPSLGEIASNALGTYDTGWLQAFDARLLAGCQAELPAITREQAAETVAVEIYERHRSELVDQMLPGDRKKLLSLERDLHVEQWELLLLPVWVATCSVGGQPYRVWVNGQSAQVAGELPVSWKVLLSENTWLLALAAGLAGLAACAWLLGMR